MIKKLSRNHLRNKRRYLKKENKFVCLCFMYWSYLWIYMYTIYIYVYSQVIIFSPIIKAIFVRINDVQNLITEQIL